TLLDGNSIMGLNDDCSEILENGLLLVGLTPNGDWLAIDFTVGKGRTGFLSHESTDYSQPRATFAVLGSSLGKALKVIEDASLSDYMDALEWRKARRQTRKRRAKDPSEIRRWEQTFWSADDVVFSRDSRTLIACWGGEIKFYEVASG